MDFESILWEHPEPGGPAEEPECFRDLNLDQIVDAVAAGRPEYDLKPFFRAPLRDPGEIAYRHEVMRDLENENLFRSIASFSERMRSVRRHRQTAEKVYYKHGRQGWLLHAAATYGEAVEGLLQDLLRSGPQSRGLRAFREYLARYAASDGFLELRRRTKDLKAALSSIRYCMLLRDSSITVLPYRSEEDYSAAVEKTFSKFKQGEAKDYRASFPESPGMNHVEAEVLERVARLNPGLFLDLEAFCDRHADFADGTILRFDREVQFYAAWLEHIAPFKRAGLKFCYPEVSKSRKDVNSREGFDLALAGKLLREEKAVVCNDFTLSGKERFLVVTGPNQGGKTTFARAFGQMHFLASLGVPVPGAEARLFLFDRLFTHFEREEDRETLRGGLQDDMVRIHRILSEATPDSIVVINELFSSTTLRDAVDLGRKIMESLSRLDALGVWVTFLDEISSLNEKTVSMVAQIVPGDPTRRTYRIERRPADGLAYALALAGKHRLTYADLKERLKP